MGRRTVGILVGLALAFGGTLALIWYVRGAEARILEGQQAVEVLVADEIIERGTPVTELQGRVETTRVPAAVQVPGSVDSLDALDPLGVASIDLLPGEQLTTSRFVPVDELRDEGDVEVPEGLQELTLSLPSHRVVAGQVRAGDRVGVVASFETFTLEGAQLDSGLVLPEDFELPDQTPDTTAFLLHKVLVTDVLFAEGSGATGGLGTGGGTATTTAPGGNILVTLALDAPQVERTVFAAEFGRLWLTAEPEEAVEDGTEPRTRGNVYPRGGSTP